MNKPTKTHRRMSSVVGLVVSLTIFLTLSVGSAAQGRSKAPSSTDKKAIEQLFAAWNSHDADKVANVFTEDAVYEDVTAGHISRGRAEVRKWREPLSSSKTLRWRL